MSSPPRPIAAAPTLHAAPSAPRAWSHRPLIIGLLLAGFALRLLRLGTESLWYDETVSVYLASQSVAELIAHTARDIHPPAYYLLLHGWRLVAQPTVAFGLEFLYAWPSLCLDIVVLALTYAIARRCFGVRAACWALGLAAIHPTQFWFAQEVRMYALGAFCVLLTLWAVSPFLAPANLRGQNALPWVTRLLYPFAALLGLYTLYYFLFWLLALNAGMIIRLWRTRRPLLGWLGLQFIVAIGWLPWLPILLRQSLTPPVPTWREPWQDVSAVVTALYEAIAAMWIAHTYPLGATWLWALGIVALAMLYFVYAKQNRLLRWLWLLLTFGPPALLFAATLIGPPIYHVRYIATYAPLFVLLVAALLGSLRLVPAATTFVALAVVSAISIQELLTSPQFAADDHRSAVATLADMWRPGDAILVNAGWAYTALSVYWPTELPTPDAAHPPSLGGFVRLTPGAIVEGTGTPLTPLLVLTGSVDGEPSLGWNLPESDFFALSGADTIAALDEIGNTYNRILHYRIYDTVSDPDGLIRQWLNATATLATSQAIPGRDFLRLETYRTANPLAPPGTDSFTEFPAADLSLTHTKIPDKIHAGEILYTDLMWQTSSGFANSNVALSLRLFNMAGQSIVQRDVAVEAGAAAATVQTVALPIPADTIPGRYQLGLIVYSPATLTPFSAFAVGDVPLEMPLMLDAVTVNLPKTVPHVSTVLGSFDYINLIHATLPATPLAPGTSFEASFTWRPQPSDYRDHYRASLDLVDDQEKSILLHEFDLGSESYPSSLWPARYAVEQHVKIALPADMAPGTYAVELSMTRASDGQVIAARKPWPPWPQPSLEIGAMQVK